MTTARDKIAEIISEMVRYDGFMGAWDAHDAADEILAALPDMIAPLVWQPIETAPKDGTGFLYLQKLPFGQKWIGSAIYHSDRFVHVQWTGECDEWTTLSPSHWMPLPAPPTITP
jgi:hypothetical protein